MRMKPKTCLSFHKDLYKRLHWALITKPECHISFRENANSNFVGYHIPADGYGYMLDTTIGHTALNPSNYDRYHLVIDIIE